VAVEVSERIQSGAGGVSICTTKATRSPPRSTGSQAGVFVHPPAWHDGRVTMACAPRAGEIGTGAEANGSHVGRRDQGGCDTPGPLSDPAARPGQGIGPLLPRVSMPGGAALELAHAGQVVSQLAIGCQLVVDRLGVTWAPRRGFPQPRGRSRAGDGEGLGVGPGGLGLKQA
jgi:hypothetical protein